jgi:hypothetical protein
VVGAADLAAFKDPSFKIGVFMGTLPGEREIFSFDKRQENLTPAQIDLFHCPRRQLTGPGYRNIGYSHDQAAAFCS